MKNAVRTGAVRIEPLETRIAPAFTAALATSGINLADSSTFNGHTNGDTAGSSVSAAGDVNGDGFGDFIIGASGAGSGDGAVYVVFGNSAGFPADTDLSTLDGTNGFKLTGEAGSFAGASVGAAGDFNGDGFDDVVIGAPFAATDAGAIYVVFGKSRFVTAETPGFSIALSSLDAATGFRIQGGSGDEAGQSVSGAGDVDGDGFDDVIIGAPKAPGAVAGSGAAFLILGKAGGSFKSIVALNGAANGDLAGTAVSGAGDVNGDGFDDVIVGAPGADGGGKRGAAYVVFGGASLSASIPLDSVAGNDGFKFKGAAEGDRAGASVSKAGDVNGDGFADVIVGAPDALYGGNRVGAFYVLFGHSGAFTTPLQPSSLDSVRNGFAVSSSLTGDALGTSVSTAGDVNGDGFDDLIVGLPQTGVLNGIGGAVLVFGHSGSFAGQPDAIFLSGAAVGNHAGSAVSSAGDVNGDGFADLLVSASLAAGGGSQRGETYLVLGGQGDTKAKFIAPTFSNGGKTAMWTDVDGDLVTLKVSKGTLDASNFSLLANSATDPRARLLMLDIGAAGGTPNPEFDQANVTFSVKRVAGGDGKVNVGFISGTNVDLGAVSVPGDLGRIFAGDDNGDHLGLKSLTVGSLGTFGGLTSDSFGLPFSVVAGGMGALKIAGDMAGGGLFVNRVTGATSGAGIASVTIGGSLIGGKFGSSGTISADDTIGPVKIAGDVLGGAGAFSGQIFGRGIGNVMIGGDVRGGAGNSSANLQSGTNSTPTDLGKVTIKGSVIGGDGAGSAVVAAGGSIGKVTIGGSQLGGDGASSGVVAAGGSIGKVTIGGDQIVGRAGSGVIQTGGNIASVTIGGDARTSEARAATIFASGTLGPVVIKGDVIGVAGHPFWIEAGGSLTDPRRLAIASVTVGGDFVHGRIDTSNAAAPGNGHGPIGPITVGGDWIASSAAAGVTDAAGRFDALGSGRDIFQPLGPAGAIAFIQSVTIKGQARGTIEEGDRYAIVAEEIGFVSIGGQKLPLKPTPRTGDTANDLAAIHVGPTSDFVVREISRTAPQTPEPGVTLPGAGPRTAQPAVVNLGSLDGSNGFKLSGVADRDRSGKSVSGGGDVNGDGFDDVIVGAYLADEGGTDRGASYVVFGKAGGFGAALNLSALDGTNGFKLSGVANRDFSGLSVSGAGDINGDGFADLIVGASQADEGGTDRGAGYVVFGKADFSSTAGTLALSGLDGTNGFKLFGVADKDYAGFSVSRAGDVNGDGLADLILGAHFADEGGTNRGASYVVFGKAGGFDAALNLSALDGSNGFKLSGAADNDYSGISVSGAGDVNGDGFADLLIGAKYAAEGGTKRGASYVVFGKTDFSSTAGTLALSGLDGSNGFKLSGVADNDRSGFSVSGAGDVNGDGFADLIVGAFAADEGGTDRGASYVVFGKADFSSTAGTLALSALNGSNGFKLSGVADNDFSGFSVSEAGDVNGDGLADLIVGAHLANEGSNNRGASYVVFGKAGGFDAALNLSGLDGSNGFKLSGVASFDYSGFSVSGAGDVNGDGFADLIVGAKYAAEGGTKRGASYVVFGGPSGEFIDPTFSTNHKTATWTDVDGDLVTLKVSKGTLDAGNFQLLAKSTGDSRARLLSLDVSVAFGTPNPEFDGADITLTAKRAGGGDGKVNLGFLNAANVDLGAVTISGDLGGMYVGDAGDDTGLKSLTVGSVRAFHGLTQDTGGDSQIFIAGPAGSVKVAGDFYGKLSVNAAATADSGTLASLTIGGSLIGGAALKSGSITANFLGAVKIGGDLVGGAGDSSGHVLGGVVGNFTLGGSMIGGSGSLSSGVQSFGKLGNVTIGGSQIGGKGDTSAAIFTGGNIGKVSIAGNQVGGGIFSAIIFAGGSNIASVTIGGDVRGGSAFLSGGILAGVTVGPVAIRGDVIGTAEHPYTIRGSGPQTGTKSLAITSLKVGGDLDHALILGGFGANNAAENGHAQIGAITVGGDWIGSSVTAGLLTSPGATDAVGVFGNGDDVFINAGPAGVVASIASITIKGRAVGTTQTGDFFGIVAEQIGPVKVNGEKLTFPGNPDAGFSIGPTPDFAVFEVGRN